MSFNIKSTERKNTLNKRQAISPEYLSQASSKICKHIINFDKFQSSEYIACYYPFKNEVNTLSLIKDKTKKFLFPKVVKGSKKLRFYHIDSLEQFKVGTFGVMEPSSSLQIVDIDKIDMFITPGVAFSKRGERIGYGGGYYDTSLSYMRPDSITIGACLDIQIISDGFSDEWDIKLKYLVSESAIIKC